MTRMNLQDSNQLESPLNGQASMKIRYPIRFLSLVVMSFAVNLSASPCDARLAAQASPLQVLIHTSWEGRITAAQDDVPQAAVNLFREAAQLQNQGEYDLAADVWESFVKRFPEVSLTPKANHYLGVCRLQSQKIEEARNAFSAAIASSTKEQPFPLLEDALLNVGWCQFNLAQQGTEAESNYPASAETFTRLLAEFPDGKYVDQANYFLGEARYLQGQAKESIEPYRTVVDEHPEAALRPNAMYALGIAYEDTKQAELAEQTYQTFIADYASHELASDVKLRLAELTLQQGLTSKQANQTSQAEAKFTAALEQFAKLATQTDFPDQDLALFKQAYCQYQLGDETTAAALYADVATKYPESSYAAPARLSAGRFFYRAGDFEKASKWLNQVAQGNDAAAVEAAHWLCRIDIQNDRFAEAYETSTQTLARDLPESEYSILLALDQADAANGIPERHREAFDLYLAIANAHPDDKQASQGWYYAAFNAFESQRYEDALPPLASYQKQNPNGDLLLDVLSLQGEAQLQLARYDDASKSFSDLTQRGEDRPEFPSWTLRQALSLYLLKDSPATLDLLDKHQSVFEAKPAWQAEAAHLRGATYFRDEKWDLAQQALQSSLTFDPQWRQADETHLLLSRALFRLDQYDAAIAQVNKLLAQFPSSSFQVEANYRLGEFLYAKGNNTAALEAYSKVIASDDEAFRPYALDGRAWTLLREEDYEGALDSFTNLLTSYPDNSLSQQALYGQSVSLNQLGKYDEALASLDKYLQLELTEAQLQNAQFEKALAMIGNEQSAEAIAQLTELQQSASKFPRMPQVLYELGWCYLDTDQSAKAAEVFTQLADEYPDSENAAEACFHAGESLYASKDYAAASKKYEQALAKSPTPSVGENATYKLGWSQFQLEQFNDAQTSFESLAEKYANGSLALDAAFMIAESLYRQSKFEEALSRYQQLIPKLEQAENSKSAFLASSLLHGSQSAAQVKDWPTTLSLGKAFTEQFPEARELAEAWLQVGQAHRGLDQDKEAIDALEKAALQSSDHVGAHARFLIGEIHFASQSYDEALIQFRRVMLGFGGEQASDKVKTYQAMSAYEAGRCAEVQIKQAAGDERTKHIADAKKFYGELVQNFPNSPYAAQAQKRLTALSSINE